MLVGRESELATVSAMLDGVRDGRGGALVLHGDIGCGRSALLAAAEEAAARRGIAVVRASPRSGRPRAHRAVTTLLRESRDERRAVGCTGTSLEKVTESGRYRLALHVLDQMAARPTLIVADDADELSESCWELLACVGRRLDHHPVGLLGAWRDAPVNDHRLARCGLAESALAPLHRPEAELLLDATAPGLSPAARETALTGAGGNPLALIEFGRFAGRQGLSPDPPPVGPSVARIFSALVDSLPLSARAVLLVAALGRSPALSEVLPIATMADGRPIDPTAVAPAVAAGLLEVDDDLRLRVRHPLVRAVLWHRTDPQVRERVRAALRRNPAPSPEPSPWAAERRRPGRLGDARSGASDVAKLRAMVEALDDVDDAGEAVALLNALAVRFYWSPPDGRTQRALMAVADSVGLSPEDPRQLHLLATTDPVGHGAIVLERIERLRHHLTSSPYEHHLLGIAANAIGAYDLAATFQDTALPGLLAQGHQAVAARALAAQGWAAAQLGDTRLGLSAAEAARPLAAQTRQPMAVVVAELTLGLVAALRGHGAQARDLAAAAERSLHAAALPYMLAKVRLVRGVAAIGERQYAEAYNELRRIFDENDRAYHPYIRFCAIGPLAEAGSLCGRQAEVAALTAVLEPVAALGRSPVLRHGLRYARAVVAPTDKAPMRFEQALSVDASGWPFERARLELAYGIWLRRERRPAEARDALRSAMMTFDAMGVEAWGARARRELRSVRGAAPGSADGLAGLTEQQRRVAHLAAAGLTNREIAGRLYLSPRTVTTHLSRVYATVAAGSRAGLAQILAGERGTDT